jgi:hypothetical protein
VTSFCCCKSIHVIVYFSTYAQVWRYGLILIKFIGQLLAVSALFFTTFQEMLSHIYGFLWTFFLSSGII